MCMALAYSEQALFTAIRASTKIFTRNTAHLTAAGINSKLNGTK